MNEKIYIVIKNHDSLQHTIPCIESLKNISYENKKIVVIDDCSKYIPYSECNNLDVELIHLNKYSDFCKCFNVGIKYALDKGADYIFVVNNDTKGFSTNYFEEILKIFDSDQRIGMVGSKCLNYDGTEQWGETPHIHFNVSMDVPTCGYVLRAKMIKAIGAFDTNLYRYFEDLDFIIRLRANGWKTAFTSKVSFYHLGGGTSSKMTYITNYYQARNLIWFIKQHYNDSTISEKCKYIVYGLMPQYREVRRGRNKLTTLYSTLKGLTVGILSKWNINHDI